MDFSFTEEQNILRKTARDFLESKCPSAFVLEMEKDERGYTEELWRGMAELGWMALTIPEEYEGVGGDFLDLVVMLEEMGRACLPGPFFSTVVLGAYSVMEAGNESQMRELLPKIATGNIFLTLAYTEPGTTKYDPYLIKVNASDQDRNFIIDGTKLFVPDAHVADYVICAARTSGEPSSQEGITLFRVDTKSSGIEYNPLKTIAGDKQYEVIFDKVHVPEEDILGGLNNGGRHLEKILQKGAVGKCAEMVGGAQRVLEMASSYAKEREQFGKPIGSYQAVQHHCANMLMDVESSRFITYKAGWMLSKGIPCTKEVSAAKAWVGEACRRVSALGHQVLGATAYIVEHDMPLYSRRAKAAEASLGDAGFFRHIMAQEIGL
ncbi:MAG: acyl-CoA/acyl-ACP dehydrogenase [Deltaproteobacteria bacterium]|nr:acyl-CoA/acyl-ACP dehydrogenase [Deltaproteobacteria bacterium]